MSKRNFKMIVPIAMGRGSRKDTKNIHKYINKVTCDAKEWSQPSEAVRFVEEELMEYPFSEETEASPKRQEFLKIHMKQNYLKERVVRFLKLSLKLQKKISFLELQEVQQLLPQLSREQIRQNQHSLKILGNRICYTLLNSPPEPHVLEAAQKLMESINKILSSKAKQLF